MQNVLFALWFLWPAGIATLMPVLAAHAPGLKDWNAPMDGGKTFRGQRIFGPHKTWRGFLAGGLSGSLWFLVQIALYNHSSYIRDFCPVDLHASWAPLLGVLLSFGSVIGDAVGSFLKRQAKVPSGASWFPADQIDFIVGALVCSLPLVRLRLIDYVIIIAVWIAVHLFFGFLGYVTKLKPSII